MRWFALLSLMVVSQALAATAFQSKDDVGKWMASYYLRPDPEGVPDAIKYMRRACSAGSILRPARASAFWQPASGPTLAG
jgi:hypothetical protein